MTTSPTDVRTWSMLCHLSALALLLFSWGGLLGPLIVWLIKRQDAVAIDENGKEALNFQITVFILYMIVLFLVIGFTGIGASIFGSYHIWEGFGYGAFGMASLLGLIQLLDVIFIIIASVTTNRTGSYRYPFALRLIK